MTGPQKRLGARAGADASRYFHGHDGAPGPRERSAALVSAGSQSRMGELSVGTGLHGD